MYLTNSLVFNHLHWWNICKTVVSTVLVEHCWITRATIACFRNSTEGGCGTEGGHASFTSTGSSILFLGEYKRTLHLASKKGHWPTVQHNYRIPSSFIISAGFVSGLHTLGISFFSRNKWVKIQLKYRLQSLKWTLSSSTARVITISEIIKWLHKSLNMYFQQNLCASSPV